MQYFDIFPKILTKPDGKNSLLLTNLMARSSIISDLLNNPMVYYRYDIQEGDTPEIIAHKYYGDSYRYWIVLFANQIMNPQWDWPMSSNVFNSYINDKYPVSGSINVYGDVHHYEKIVTSVDSGTMTTTKETFQIEESDYDSLDTSIKNYSLPTGNVTLTIDKRAVSYYDYEYEKNESLRNIKILNRDYVIQIERELRELMVK